ncbi:dihydrolipoamide acetyltransferase family protein [Lentzea flaviverrucosa]|uniref:Dihydrolipoamide acetyltransferase component of pyruvate dehydrogenase complex n=1 Tax=Lentzea flaviverrucosa TaxID=200379 RepID=A0A1H9Q2A8_9PSEU|nr:dihydrolipoamide acetyltransferase family protein [Lentzea flaviverrucosa]RDI29649.1 pyruvate dehydrogenase E2 component (dihydrolipoamide acetyltransferase) [Lentzea flaviverrucosa]SER54570.1 pyruvate dehydrogenase E2 component (dihydrolipoamide acetyltransferase) [Lentzea flaviverrucosa]
MPQYKQFPLPDTAEGLTEAEILTWHVKPGDTVKVNQIIVEIETAKAAVELPCPWAGVVTELLAEPGQTVEVGVPIITIDTDPGGAAAPAPAPVAAESNGASSGKIGEEMPGGRIATLVGYGPKSGTAKRRARKDAPAAAPAAAVVAPPAPAPVVAPPAPVVVAAPVQAPGGYVPLAKPPVRKLAKDLGVDLHALTGSGPGGVITREDVETAVSAPAAAPAQSVVDNGSRERRVPIKGVRKATAQAMVDSAFTAPHVTEFLTVDVTPMMELRARLKNAPEFRGVKLTPLAFCAKAIILAARRTPDVNATWDAAANEIVYKDYVHLGIAAATPRGLVVPKVRDADRMSLKELAIALDELATVAREGKTSPADMMNGTITITNVGVFGVDTGTPILNPGESAILALGAIRDMPWVVDGEIKIRKICQLALSFDHRVVDGQQGSQFLADVGALLAEPGIAMTY